MANLATLSFDRKFLLLAAGSMALAACQCAAQAGSATPPAASTPASQAYVPTMTFDVASVRETKHEGPGFFRVGGGFEPPEGGTLRLVNSNLSNVLFWAYGSDAARRVEGIPRDFFPLTFNVEAKCGSATEERLAKLTREQIELEHQHMVQALLADRFQLKAHAELRESRTYDLVVAKAGRLRSTGAAPSADELKGFGNHPIPTLYQRGDTRRGFEYVAHGASMDDIVEQLKGQLGTTVTDKTGLIGKYDFILPYYQIHTDDRKDDETNPWLPLETAIQNELGLKLVPTRGKIQVLVVDHVEKPSEN